MEYRKIPGTDCSISVIGLGTWVLGGDSWSGAKITESLEAVAAAVDSGINFIDTAPIYGNGISEEIVGKAITGKRDKIILATKCGLTVNAGRVLVNLTPQSIIREVEDSLRRLQTDYIDLYQCHWPDPKTPLEDTMKTLVQLKEQGKIRYIGISNFELPLIKRARELADVVTLQNQFSLLTRDLEKEIIPHCREKGIGVLTYGALGGGILSGKYITPPKFRGSDARSFFYKHYQGKAFEQTKELLRLMERFNKPLHQVAINWVRQTPGVTSVLVGCRNAQQVHSNVQALDWDLPSEGILELTKACV